jgi:GT2 family glycosyltransferase
MVYCPLNIGIDFFEMLSRFGRIMYHDYQKNNGTFRILWKSVARWRRLGWDGMLEWLDKEIWKIPNDQKKLAIDAFAYKSWIEKKEPQLFLSDRIDSGVKFSVVLIVESNKASISRLIDLLISQHYKNWELIIVGDSLDVAFANKHFIIMAVDKSNAIAKATGEWIIFTDPYMVLSAFALTELSEEIQRNPNVEFIYSDEDTIDESGKRSNPYFKSDFNLDLLYSMSYIGSTFACKTSVARDVRRFDESMNGCPAYDFVLRVLENIGEKAIFHIPKILFHFLKTDVNIGMREECERQVLREHFKRIKKDVIVSTGLSTLTHRVRWPLPNPSPLVSIIIPTRDQVEILQQCINSIRDKTTYSSYEIIIVDNQSESCDTLQYLENLSLLPYVKILKYDGIFNYAAINNYAVANAKGEIIVLLNNDAEVISPNWLDEMVFQASRQEIGCVGAMLYYPDDTIQHAGVILGLGDVAGHTHKYMVRGSGGYFNRACSVQNFSAVTAACLAIRKEVYEEVGGLDEVNLTVAYNDVDLCLKVQEAGYRNLWTPYAELYHYESKSRGKDNTPAKKKRYLDEVAYMHEKWSVTLKNDPYYHPTLTKTAEQFQLRRMG